MRLYSRWFPGTVAAVSVCMAAAPFDDAAAGAVRPIEVRRPASMTGAERVYWIGTGAGDEDAMALREALAAAGARNVNLFVPEMVIVCDVPPAAAPAVSRVTATGPFRIHDTRGARAAAAAEASWGWIVDGYALADRILQGEAADALNSGDAGGFRDEVLTISPQRVEEIQRQVEMSRSLSSAERPVVARRINQNSEFLGGYILANFIYPESNGARDGNSETWTDEDMRQAKAGATAAFVSWQGKFPNMDIAFVIHHFERVPTGYEPILHDMNTDELWLVDTMRSMGWARNVTEPQAVVHEFNEFERTKWRTQWVVTSFIANSRNTPDHRFKSGTAPYTAYAYLGGPFMIEPFPAGTDPNGIGETLVYSQIVNHEIAHLFYALDEYPGAPGVCATRSGYLDWDNGNVTMTDPGGNQARCIPLVPCIMHTAARLAQGRPWCDYTQGQIGVLDSNGNAIPDIFEAEPQITFVPEGPETVTTNSYLLHFKAKATAVPNRNPNQGPERVSYALPLDGAKILLGSRQIGLDALDKSWNEVEEEAQFSLTGLEGGSQLVLTVEVENEAGFRSQRAIKTVFIAGVNFERLAVVPKWNRIELSWETPGETFGAKYDVYRIAPGESAPGTVIAADVRPVGTGNNGQPQFRIRDFDVAVGSEYHYYVEAVFELPHGGGTREYRSRSAVVGQTAMVRIVDVVSNLAPNPTRGTVTFSVAVPPLFNETSQGPARVPTALDVRVYNVRGQLIRTLKRSSELDAVVTLRWDGTTQSGDSAPSGVYFLRVKAGDTEAVRKIVLLR